MSKNKQYKNVYTILEKAKKGELDGYYKGDGLFGKIDFYKKPDLIKPTLHYLDEDRIKKIVEAHFSQGNMQDYFKRLSGYSKFKAIPDDKKPDFHKFINTVMENMRKFPAHIARDIHKMFYHKIDKLEFEERTAKNQLKYKFLERANNPVGKIMSEGSSLKSSIFARNIMFQYIMQMSAMEYIDPDQHKQMMSGLNGEGDEFNQEDLSKMLDKMMDNKFAKDQMDKAMQDAQDLCKTMDDSVPDDIQERMFKEANQSGGNEAGKLSPDYMRQIAERLEKVHMSLGSLKDKIKKMLDKTTSYFSGREIVIYDDIFNSDNLAGLDEYVMLHPKLRKIMAEDVQIKDIKRLGKIDIYIDVSGSMSSSCGVRNHFGQLISKIDFCKSFTAKLSELNMLNDVYLFDTRVKKYRNDMVSIAMIDCGGGTTIDNAVANIERVGNNAIIITDAEDSCYTYSDKAFFIGINGARFNSFHQDVIGTYSERSQVIEFDGTRIYNIGKNGLRVGSNG